MGFETTITLIIFVAVIIIITIDLSRDIYETIAKIYEKEDIFA